MLLFDEIPQPLMFYDDIRKQARYHPEYECCIYGLPVEKDRLVPFQVRFFEGEQIERMSILSLCGTESYNIPLSNLASEVISEFQYYLWFADHPIFLGDDSPLDLVCGTEYYIKIETTEGAYYSEVFKPIKDIDEKYLQIEWFDEHPVDPAFYSDELSFKFRFFCETYITKGTPTIIIESEEDGHGEVVDISRKVNVTYEVALGVVPNYILEAMYFMSIHRIVTVITPKSLRQGDIKNISVIEEQIDMAPFWAITINFQQGRYYYNKSCASDIKPPVIDEYLIDQGMTGELYDTFIEQQNISE